MGSWAGKAVIESSGKTARYSSRDWSDRLDRLLEDRLGLGLSYLELLLVLKLIYLHAQLTFQKT